jgi:hypothetical protein
MVYVFGGDGTLLNLLRELYIYYKSNIIPVIAAFNLVCILFILIQIFFIQLIVFLNIFITGISWISLQFQHRGFKKCY